MVVTTRTSPGRHCSIAAWIIRLSPGQFSTVTAEPAIRAPSWIGRSAAPTQPSRPIASCTVGDAVRAEGVDGRGIRSRDVGDDDAGASDGAHASTSVTCG